MPVKQLALVDGTARHVRFVRWHWGGESDDIEYLDLQQANIPDDAIVELMFFVSLIKIPKTVEIDYDLSGNKGTFVATAGILPALSWTYEAVQFVGTSYMADIANTVTACAIHFNDSIVTPGNMPMTIREMLVTTELGQTLLNDTPRLTKEEFYSFES